MSVILTLCDTSQLLLHGCFLEVSAFPQTCAVLLTHSYSCRAIGNQCHSISSTERQLSVLDGEKKLVFAESWGDGKGPLESASFSKQVFLQH